MLTRAAPFAIALLAIAACSTAEPTPAPTPTATPLSLGPTSTPISEAQLERIWAELRDADEIFAEEFAVSDAVVANAAAAGMSDIELDEVIRRETVRLVRAADSVRLFIWQKNAEAHFECFCIIDRSSPDAWVHTQMTEVVAWMRDQQKQHLGSPPERPLTTPDAALSATLALVVEMFDAGYGRSLGLDVLYFSASRAARPFSSSVAVSGMVAATSDLNYNPVRPGFLATPLIDNSDRAPAWRLNPETMPALLTAIEFGSLGPQTPALKAFAQSLIARDFVMLVEIGDEPGVYEVFAQAIRGLPDLPAADFAAATRTGASVAVRSRVAALEEQIGFLRGAGISAADIRSLNVALEGSGLSALAPELERVARYMDIADAGADVSVSDALLVPVADDLHEMAESGQLQPATLNAMLTDAADLDLADGAVAEDADGKLTYGESSFLLHRRYYDYDFAYFPEMKRLLRTYSGQLKTAPALPDMPGL